MKLGVFDRIAALHVLPREGDLITLRVLRDLKQRLGFTEEELAVLNIQSTEKGTNWELDAVGEIEILIGPKAHSMIVESFKSLDAAKKLTLELLPVYEKFLKEEE